MEWFMFRRRSSKGVTQTRKDNDWERIGHPNGLDPA
jgi:hypothetical protein